jgi:hypothetical protein
VSLLPPSRARYGTERRARLGGAALGLLLCACRGLPDPSDITNGTGNGASPELPGESGCVSIGQSQAALSLVDRSIVGSPADYLPDASFSEREQSLRRSQRLRREAAWNIAERVLSPVGLAQPLAGAAGRSTLPLWQTWHAKDDLTRIFRKLYPELSPEERAARVRFSGAALDAGSRWNDGAIDDFEDWTLERLLEYRSAIDQTSEVAGLGGIYRVGYAPVASRHLLTSYPEVLACREDPAAAAEPPGGDPAQSGCARVASPTCLASSFPRGAVLVKANWRRVGAGAALPVFDTSAAGLQRRLASDASFDWGTADGEADPGEDEIYTLRLPNGNVFRLAALHIMTKELEQWFWTTLWWSPEPDQDFGADRPGTLPAPFQNYKLCSVVAFDEEDPDPGGGFDQDHPSLARALQVTHAGSGGASWCSNPYQETGVGNAGSNCIGCHQHAGTGLRSADILGAPLVFPDHGRTQLRADFPSDYVFAPSVGDDLGAMYEETETHFSSP